jgi:membrane-associated phospholipid phosphatase
MGIALGELLLEYLVSHLAEAVIVTVGRHALRQATRRAACGPARAVPRAPHSPRELRQPMAPGACSQLPGRVRLAVPGLRDSPTIIPLLLAHVRSLPGIHSATASALTGNALIVYDPRHISLAAILAVVAAEPTACGTGVPYREW